MPPTRRRITDLESRRNGRMTRISQNHHEEDEQDQERGNQNAMLPYRRRRDSRIMNLKDFQKQKLEAEEEEEVRLLCDEGFRQDYYVLTLEFYGARDLEFLKGPFKNSSAWYQICVTDIKNQREFRTREARAEGDLNQGPVWNCAVHIELDDLPNEEEEESWLYIEVLQCRDDWESDGTGTSYGVNVVGRVKIPVPTKLGDSGTMTEKLVRMVEDEKKVDAILHMRVKLHMKKRYAIDY